MSSTFRADMWWTFNFGPFWGVRRTEGLVINERWFWPVQVEGLHMKDRSYITGSLAKTGTVNLQSASQS
jgi:hypothetical protein